MPLLARGSFRCPGLALTLLLGSALLLAPVAARDGHAATALTTLPAGAKVVRASDTLGRDISGNGQGLKPLGPGSRPLLVQVLDAEGAPLAGVDVVFRVEPGIDEQGNSYVNGGLVPLATVAPGVPRYNQRPPSAQGGPGEPMLTVRSDLQGFAGAYLFPSRRIEPVQVSASLVANRSVSTNFVLRVIDPRWKLLLWSGLLGGLALFLVGMRMTTTGLEQVAGNRLRAILGRATENRGFGLLTGIVVTALIQSSSATTVMVVSFVNAGLLSLGQTLAIILGADIGTTLTVQLIAFSLKDYSLLIVFGGLVLSFLRGRTRPVGQFLIGVGLIFYGMALMGKAMDPLRETPAFRQVLLASAEQPLLVLLVAMIFTGLIHNSAAAIGVALTLAAQGLIGLQTAIPVILGANIGTCVTAFLASIGTRREAVRAALAHIVFKVAGVCLFLPFIKPFATLVAGTSSDLPRQIANAHTLFNVAAALIFLPTLAFAERLLRRLVPDVPHEDGERTWRPKYIDERIMELPALALAQVSREIARMGDTVLRMLREGYVVIRDRDEARMQAVIKLDDKVDALDGALRHYLTRLGRTGMEERQSARAASYLYMVHHLESIGDLISKNLMGLAQKVMRDDLRFSAEGARQWSEYYQNVIDMLQKALAAFATNDREMAREVVAQKAVMARRARDLYFEHMDRLGKGIPETEQTSDIHIHLIADLRRVVSNAASIGAAVVNEYRLPDAPTENDDEDVGHHAPPVPSRPDTVGP